MRNTCLPKITVTSVTVTYLFLEKLTFSIHRIIIKIPKTFGGSENNVYFCRI